MATIEEKRIAVKRKRLAEQRARQADTETVEAVAPVTEEQGFLEAAGETVQTLGSGIAAEVGSGLSGLIELALTQATALSF